MIYEGRYELVEIEEDFTIIEDILAEGEILVFLDLSEFTIRGMEPAEGMLQYLKLLPARAGKKRAGFSGSLMGVKHLRRRLSCLKISM